MSFSVVHYPVYGLDCARCKLDLCSIGVILAELCA